MCPAGCRFGCHRPAATGGRGGRTLLAMLRYSSLCAAVAIWTLVTASLVSPALADRAAIEKTLNEMSGAVLAGDAARYVTFVATSDPDFLQEQKMWAKDLLTHKPAEFSLTIVASEAPAESAPAQEGDGAVAPAAEAKPALPSAPPEVFGDASSTFTLRMTWTMPEGKERRVAYPVRFTLAPATKDQPAAWLYEGEVWTELDVPATATAAAIRVLHAPGLDKAAANVVTVMPEVREKVDALFEIKNTTRQTIKLYTSMKHLQASIYLSYVNGLAGWNEPGESIKILAQKSSSVASLRPLLAHEYGHCDTFFLGPKANDAPWWVLEGIAEFSSSAWKKDPEAGATRTVIAWAKADQLARWQDLVDFRTVPNKLHRFVYTQGEHFMHFVTAEHGAAKRNAWLRALATGQSIDDASKSAFGASFEDVSAAWRANVQAKVEASEAAKGD